MNKLSIQEAVESNGQPFMGVQFLLHQELLLWNNNNGFQILPLQATNMAMKFHTPPAEPCAVLPHQAGSFFLQSGDESRALEPGFASTKLESRNEDDIQESSGDDAFHFKLACLT